MEEEGSAMNAEVLPVCRPVSPGPALAGGSCNSSPQWMQTLGGSSRPCHSNKKGNTQPKSAAREVGR